MSLGEGWITSAALKRRLFSVQEGLPTGEHAVDEQRIDGERACGVSSTGSEQMEQQKEHAHDEKKVVALNPQQQPFVIVGLGDHDGGEDGVRDGE